ncbi:MAG: CatB-related O-acetyltransferase [Clostridia bacterium]|nr:CatB-related O-acetyltransferase [Clostridia bacterium]
MISAGTFLGKSSVMKFTKVGKYCDLSWQLSIGGSNHNYKAACMYTDTWWKKIFGVGDGLASVEEADYTVIGNDVWMGSKANVVRGVTVGDGAVIGASALVLEDIPPYAIAVGCPARVIKYRFDAETVERLLRLQWWDWEIETIRAAADCLRGDLTEEKLTRLEQFARER